MKLLEDEAHFLEELSDDEDEAHRRAPRKVVAAAGAKPHAKGAARGVASLQTSAVDPEEFMKTREWAGMNGTDQRRWLAMNKAISATVVCFTLYCIQCA